MSWIWKVCPNKYSFLINNSINSAKYGENIIFFIRIVTKNHDSLFQDKTLYLKYKLNSNESFAGITG